MGAEVRSNAKPDARLEVKPNPKPEAKQADKGHYVITLSRSSGSGATYVARILQKDLGIPFYNKELYKMASDESGINEALFYQANEDQPESFLYRIARNESTLFPPGSSQFLSRGNLFNYQAKVLNDLAQKESYMIVGKAADYALRNFPRVYSVFLYAPDEVCIRTTIDKFGFDRDEAIRFIKKKNKYRSRYYERYAGKAWGDMRNYDLCINTAKTGYEGAAKLIETFLELHPKSQTETE